MLSSEQSFRLYEIVRRYFQNENDARAFITEIENVINQKFDAEKDRLATKDDIQRLELKIGALEVKIAEVKADIIKWMFIFWLGQIGATIGIILLFVKR